MTKTLNFTVEVSDEQYNNFIQRMLENAAPTGLDGGDDEGPINATAPLLDSAGIPWLETVHAGTKGMTVDGKWRGKKGVTPDQRAAAEAAWRASQGAASQGAAPAPTASPAAMPGMPGAGGMPGMPGATAAPAPVSYNDVIGKYQSLAAAGKITQDQLGPVYAAAGVTDVNTLQTDETQRALVMAELNKFS